MAKYEGVLGPTDYRFMIHGGFFDTDIERDYGEYDDAGGAYALVFETNDEQKARRIFDCIYENNALTTPISITGMYLHQKLVWHHDEYHPELMTCGHAIDMDWHFEDNESTKGEFFSVTIFEQPYEED